MSLVDAIRPPKKKKKAPPAKKLPVTLEKQEFPGKTYKDKESKKQLMWILASITALVILVGWVFLFQGGQLTKNTSDSSFFSTAGQKLTNLWETIKTDILKIESALEKLNTNSEEKKIEELEEQVFPQFTDPTKQ